MLISENIEALITKELKGLCSSCSHFDGCSFRKMNFGKAIIQCELFETAEPVKVTAATSVIGLCSTCAKVTTCHLHKSPSGVWHCEEYE